MLSRLTSHDYFLQKNGLMRKALAKDQTCLFRAFAEVEYKTQTLHENVRFELYEFLSKNPYSVPDVFNCSKYFKYLKEGKLFCGLGEAKCLSFIYKKPIIIYFDVDVFKYSLFFKKFNDDIENNMIRLFFSPPCHFDLIYTIDKFAKLAIAQALMYEIFFEKILKTDEQRLKRTLDAMMKSKLFTKIRKNPKKVNDEDDEDDGIVNTLDLQSKLLTQTLPDGRITTPFPYKVAKALDSRIYRNVELDCWLDKIKNKNHKLNL